MGHPDWLKTKEVPVSKDEMWGTWFLEMAVSWKRGSVRFASLRSG